MPLIDRSAAHRSTRSESLVWAIQQETAQTWRADVELPRSHWLCHPVPDRIPLTLLAESFRQAGLAICVAGLGMGQAAHFLVSAMSVNVETDSLRFPRFGALEGELEVTFTRTQLRKGVPHILEVDYRLPGVASGHVDAQVLGDRDYQATRRNAVRLTDDVRSASTELMLQPERDGSHLVARLGVNEADPFFFDHPVDHLPGMLLLHTAAVVHEREHGTPPASLAISFPSFGELHVDTAIAAELTPGGTKTVFTQSDRVIAAASTSVHPEGS
ncbi:MAG TPA: AfsA-related hotdog domain-containing protein [Gryllotalpicola sp.]